MLPVIAEKSRSGELFMKTKVSEGTRVTSFLRSKKGTAGGAGLSKRHNSSQVMKDRLERVSDKARDIPKSVRKFQHEVKIYNGARLATVALRDKKCDAEFPEENRDREEYKYKNKRGKITEWSRKSQMRFKTGLATIQQDKLEYALEITLTYPKVFPDADEHATYKRHLDRIKIWLCLRGFSGAWKLEFQTRGAPHYHMIAIPTKKLDGLGDFRREISQRWYDIVGSHDEKHLRAGVEVSPIKSSKGMIGYMASYMAKKDQTLPNNFTGRYWGYFNKKNLPFAEEKCIPLGKENAIKIRRIFRNKIKKDMSNYQHRICAEILKKETGIAVTTQELTSSLFRLGSKCKYLTSTDRKIQAVLERGWVRRPKKWRLRNNQTVRLFCNPCAIEKHLIDLFSSTKRSLQNEGFLP